MSQVQAETTHIGESYYEMYMLPPMKSHDLLMDVVKMVGPSMGPVVDTFFSKMKGDSLEEIMNTNLDGDFFTKAFAVLFENLNKSVLNKVIDSFKTVTQVGAEGKTSPLEKIFDVHFMGKLENMYAWIAWGMRVQWGKSLSALIGEAAAKRDLLKAQQSPSPTT